MITVTGIWTEKSTQLRNCWPIQIAHLRPLRNTRVLGFDNNRADWLLSVSGPFCKWPMRNQLSSEAYRMADQLSNKLALPVHGSVHASTIRLIVAVSPEEWQRIYSAHYEEVVQFKKR
jgi:hypothetical protein